MRDDLLKKREEIFQTQSAASRLDEFVDFPKVILVDTVSFCNLKCSMCVHKQMTRKKGIMNWDLLTRIVDEISLRNKNTRVWMVFFGDPFVIKNTNPSIFDMIKYAKDRGLTDIVLNSNGCLMDEGAARKVIESGLDNIYFGVDAACPETYVKLRVGGNYDKTVKNIQTLLRIKAELGCEHPKVFVQFVEMEENEKEKKDFIQFWTEHGVTIKIRPKVSWGGSIDAKNLVLGNEERWPCHWLMQTMSITDTGKAVLCPVDLDANEVVGDVCQKSLKDIWQNELKLLRRLHIEGRYDELPSMCKNCRDWQSARADYYSLHK